MKLIFYIMLKRCIEGCFVAFGADKLLALIRKTDKENQLPVKNSVMAKICFFLAGCTSGELSFYTGILLTYLCAMAYSDWHTKQVYSFYAYLTGAIGLLGMLIGNVNRTMIAYAIFFWLLIVCGFILHVYAAGDAEILAATVPYLILLTAQRGLDTLLFFFCFFFLSVIVGILLCLVRGVQKKALEKEYAMAPAILIAVIVIL